MQRGVCSMLRPAELMLLLPAAQQTPSHNLREWLHFLRMSDCCSEKPRRILPVLARA